VNKKGEIVGMSFLNLKGTSTADRYEADFGIGVIESYRGRGVGSELTKGTVQLAERLGIRTIRLAVLTINLNAIRLYEKHGFRRLEEVKGGDCWHGALYDCIRMSLNISQSHLGRNQQAAAQSD
jgi:ribosomal protein S18 acetylase RimI-like enzyme